MSLRRCVSSSPSDLFALVGSQGVHGIYGSGAAFTMPAFAQPLYPSLGRTVVDKTGMTGSYDIALQWTPDDLRDPPAKTVESGQTEIENPGASGPSIFTALKEQLGLKLDSSTCPADTIVIDHLEKPSGN